MIELLTHVVGKDEDNVWLYAGARAEEGGGEGGEEEEEVDGGHLPPLGNHSVITSGCSLSFVTSSTWGHNHMLEF